MPDWPTTPLLPPMPVLTPFHEDSIGSLMVTTGATVFSSAGSQIWPVANKAFIYPFTMTGYGTVYQLLWWVGATSAGNIDVAIYDDEKNKVVGAGSTAMSATVNTIQELNVTDTDLAPGDYFLAGVCSLATGTCFRGSAVADESLLPLIAIFEQASAGPPLPDPLVPVICTEANIPFFVIGAQFRPIF